MGKRWPAPQWTCYPRGGTGCPDNAQPARGCLGIEHRDTGGCAWDIDLGLTYTRWWSKPWCVRRTRGDPVWGKHEHWKFLAVQWDENKNNSWKCTKNKTLVWSSDFSTFNTYSNTLPSSVLRKLFLLSLASPWTSTVSSSVNPALSSKWAQATPRSALVGHSRLLPSSELLMKSLVISP